MVVHLKRFRQSTKATNKLETMVEFPLDRFDMSPNMARPVAEPGLPSTDPPAANGLRGLSAFSPWKHPKRFRSYDREETMYELYSVCNHHGSDLLGGHYTAYCKNPTDGQWYGFDDMNTKQLTEAEVVTKDAYILFYQKTCLNTASSSSSSCSSGSSTDHWAYRMPDFVYKTKNETRCAPNQKPRSTILKEKNKKACTLSPERSKATAPAATERFARNSAKYATLPAKKPKDIIVPDSDAHSDAETGLRGADSSDEEEADS